MVTKVIKIDNEFIEFINGIKLLSAHIQTCCESHYLDFEHLDIKDFEGLEFNLSNDAFFKKIKDFGIELIPIHGHSIKIPGYGKNNGWYSDNLFLQLIKGSDIIKEYDITECQEIEE
jgi:hypothetical protein